MELRRKILKELRDSKVVLFILNEEILPPAFESQFSSFGKNWVPHPPALVPVFTDLEMPSISGYMVHPFLDRKTTFVNFF